MKSKLEQINDSFASDLDDLSLVPYGGQPYRAFHFSSIDNLYLKIGERFAISFNASFAQDLASYRNKMMCVQDRSTGNIARYPLTLFKNYSRKKVDSYIGSINVNGRLVSFSNFSKIPKLKYGKPFNEEILVQLIEQVRKDRIAFMADQFNKLAKQKGVSVTEYKKWLKEEKEQLKKERKAARVAKQTEQLVKIAPHIQELKNVIDRFERNVASNPSSLKIKCNIDHKITTINGLINAINGWTEKP